jgi:hypothetical protein
VVGSPARASLHTATTTVHPEVSGVFGLKEPRTLAEMYVEDLDSGREEITLQTLATALAITRARTGTIKN